MDAFQSFDLISALVVVVDREGRIVHWNQACSKLTGYRLEEVRGRFFWEPLSVPEEVEVTRAALSSHLSGEAPGPVDTHLHTKAGERRWLAWSSRSTVGTDGQVEYVISTGVDRTRAEAAEEARRLSEAKLAGIISIANDAIISIDEAQRITIFNEGAEEIFGWSREEALGQPLDILLPARFREIHRRDVRGFAAGNIKSRRMGERRPAIFGLRKSGEEFPAEAAISKLEANGSRLFTVVLRDVTEQKRFEAEQAFLVEAATVISATLDYQDRMATLVRLAVRALPDCCGVDLVDEEGMAWRLNVVHVDPSRVPSIDVLQRFELDRRRPHPAWSVLRTHRATPMRDVTPEDLESIAHVPEHRNAPCDIAPRSLMALPLVASDRCLGVLVFLSSRPSNRYHPRELRLAERMARLVAFAVDNARLYRAAHDAIQARDEVLRIVAHDIRNPVSAIQLGARLLRRHLPEGAGKDAQRNLEAIDRSSARAQRLIQDLMDVTRIEAGAMSVERARLPAAQLVREATEAQRDLASAASLDFQLDVAGELPDVLADRDRLFQVFENLIGNAVKFTPPGGHIRVGATPRDGEVVFWVADTGAGIPGEHLPRIFDRFWQARRSDRTGAGLGLAICKGLVEAHGGRIWAESVVGAGSTFFFTLPKASQAERWREEPAAQPP